jgi:hypothetical protein
LLKTLGAFPNIPRYSTSPLHRAALSMVCV